MCSSESSKVCLQDFTAFLLLLSRKRQDSTVVSWPLAAPRCQKKVNICPLKTGKFWALNDHCLSLLEHGDTFAREALLFEKIIWMSPFDSKSCPLLLHSFTLVTLLFLSFFWTCVMWGRREREGLHAQLVSQSEDKHVIDGSPKICLQCGTPFLKATHLADTPTHLIERNLCFSFTPEHLLLYPGPAATTVKGAPNWRYNFISYIGINI